jgi:1-pyrroline-5-carboxylate dehydrogenase
MPSEFKNEPLTDFGDPENASAMERALAKVASELGKNYDLVIGGKKKPTQDRIKSIDPSNPSTVIGNAAKATSEDAEEAIRVEERKRGGAGHVSVRRGGEDPRTEA